METAMTTTKALTQESTELLETLAKHRYFLRFTVRDLTDEQAAARTVPASRLCLGGLIKHVADCERGWVDFILHGPSAKGGAEDYDPEAWLSNFDMLPGETLAGLLAEYEQVALRTEQVVAELADLNASHPLPVAPWFEPGATWSARRVLLHIIAETSQHAGHADLLRESIDGAKTMG
jgi:uncharacterized damage-inducible protein DinB